LLRYSSTQNARHCGDQHTKESSGSLIFPVRKRRRCKTNKSNSHANSIICFQLSKALHGGSEWSDKDELLDVVYWGKQILSLIIGITFGAASMHGVLAILAYVVISTMVAQHFVVKYQQVDEDEVGGFWELAKEGFGSAFATFMVAWITVYSALYHSS
ncbi:Rab5-interacting protein, partial [Ancylostoma ceylanicum]